MKKILLTIMLSITMLVTPVVTAQYQYVQPHYNYPQPGYYVLHNTHPQYMYSCQVQFQNGYTISFGLYPNAVSSPIPMNTSYWCQ